MHMNIVDIVVTYNTSNFLQIFESYFDDSVDENNEN